MRRKLYLLIGCCWWMVALAHAQGTVREDLDPQKYPFVNFDTNYFFTPNGNIGFERFFLRLDSLMFAGTGKVNVVHFGGSHLQADVYSHRMRTLMQKMQPGINGGRGLVFPVSVIGSNNPGNFRVSSTGNWQGCRNTERNRSCNLGVAGLMATTNDSAATITIRLRNAEENYETTTLRVFFFDPTGNYTVTLHTDDPYLIRDVQHSVHHGYADITLNQPQDTFTIGFYRTMSAPATLELYGVELRNDHPGIVYHAVGVNGASIPSFLRCNLLQEQLRNIEPDLVIISLGTNDGYSKNFDPDVYSRHYLSLIHAIREAYPQTDLLLTVPNDVYFNRRRVNKNTSLQEEVIYKLAEEQNCAIWNFFQVMGGLNSVPEWYNRGLMRRDRIHFTTEGYLLKGDLLFEALMKSYGKHLESRTARNAMDSNETTH